MTLAVWTLIMLIATAVCALTIKTAINPCKGFITPKLFFVHPLLGIITIVLAILTVVNA
ncbi:MAG: hypothetical protein Q7J73_02995 [Dehalococcoidales bacterium]|nr:hypothetical protein [Dehalococcoidales bacterium]